MKAIDAAQLIVNKLSRMGQSIDRSDLTKMLYLLDLTVQKHTGKRLVDEDFTFNCNGPFVEDVYKHFQLWKDDYISGEVQVKHNLSEDFLKMLNEKISAIGKCKSWELDAIIYNQQNNGKTQELTDDMIDNYNTVKNEVLNRCRKLLEVGKTRVIFRDYGQEPYSLVEELAEECRGIKHLDTDEVFISIKKIDSGEYQLEWDSFDTFDGFGSEKVIMPADFIKDFDSYYNKIKDEIEAHNEMEKAKLAEYEAGKRLEALEAKQKEIEAMEAKLQADKAKIDKLRKNLSNSGIEL